MAAVITVTNELTLNGKNGSEKIIYGTIALDSSYPTNGEVLDLTQLPITDIKLLLVPPYKGYAFEFDDANSKLKAFNAGGNAIGTAALDTSNTYTDAAVNAAINGVTVTAGALAEVANATNLSALTAIPFLAFGN